MMKRVFLTVAAGSLALAFSCNNSSDRGNSGGEGGGSSEGGGGGSSSTGGKGGTSAKGGSGGSKANGGAGGTANGGAGGTTSGGSGGTVSGGAGGTANGGAANGGAAGGGAGGAAISHPTWNFETSVGPFNNGIAHFGDNKAQCDHSRLGVTGPVLSEDQKKDGTKSLMYDFDIPVARTEFNALGCQTCTASGDAMTCVPKATASSVTLIAVNTQLLVDANKLAGATGGVLPAGTVITLNMWWPGATAPVNAQGYILGVGINWPTQVEAQSKNLLTDGWHEFKITLETQRTLGLFWNEMGVIINSIPATFKGKVYLDAVDIKLP